jgi:hypothetical protein
MTDFGQWFLGRCVPDPMAGLAVAVVAVLHKDGSCRPLDRPEIQFPDRGTIAFSRAVLGNADFGQWLLFRCGPHARRLGPGVRILAARRLTRYVDLRHLGSVETIRRLIVEDGVEHLEPGSWAVRIDDGAVVVLTLEQGSDGKLKASGAGLERLSAQSYNPSAVVALNGAIPKLFYEAELGASPLGLLNWASDADYVRAILRGLDQGDDLQSRLEAAFEVHLEQTGGMVTRLGRLDLERANALLRTRGLLARLRQEQELLGATASLMASDPQPREPVADAIPDVPAPANDPGPADTAATAEEAHTRSGTVDVADPDISPHGEHHGDDAIQPTSPQVEASQARTAPPLDRRHEAAAWGRPSAQWSAVLAIFAASRDLDAAWDDATSPAQDVQGEERAALRAFRAAMEGREADLGAPSTAVTIRLFELAQRAMALAAGEGIQRNILLQLAGLLSDAVEDLIARLGDHPARGAMPERTEALVLAGASEALVGLFDDLGDPDCAYQATELAGRAVTVALSDDPARVSRILLETARRAADFGDIPRAVALCDAAIETLASAPPEAVALIKQARALRQDLTEDRFLEPQFSAP